MVRLQFLGAAGEVTGSSFLVTSPALPGGVLVDFGMHQGGPHEQARNRRPPPFDPARLAAVVLTHGHLDHCGRLPILFQRGYRGPVFCTPATADLSEIILEDSANIQVEDAARFARKRERAGRPAPPPPLYTVAEAQSTIARFARLPYSEQREIAPGVRIRFHDAGHILGSAWVEMRIRESGDAAKETLLVFSGDIGPRGLPLLRDPESAAPLAAECPAAVLLESTYGDRDHRSLDATLDELAAILRAAHADQGKVIIPAFAVGRTQDVLYHIGKLQGAGRVPRTPIYVDSPMALRATDLYRSHAGLFDEELKLHAPGVHFVRSPQESQRLNASPGPMVVIAASGMATAGRVLHHLRHGLWKPTTRVVFVGFQAEGTLGRKLVSGARSVRIYGERIAVRASIHTLNGFSAHAGQTELAEWGAAAVGSSSRPCAGRVPRIFLVHGEDRPRSALRETLQRRTGILAELPRYGDAVDLI